MLKSAAIKHFGTRSRIAAIAGIDPSAVSQWKELVPERCAQRLADASGGVLVYDPAVYDQHKQDRKEALNHENQSVA
ncbi:transcriptional regulator [Salmonella enterica]|uniref:Cro/CI family transcriptional regulator n=1 Tax=Salmonella enterica TaxID=28901 RepID=UPI0009B03B4C|nr:Cro/CI family transcriptional regulator [Salmonella enterica]EAA2042152.1 transcriptional regulator [Salmonella enterica subsp. enterica serovar Enteritidis]EBG8067326.1 transcriptional regulator [Salmonella enterica subsp. enterica serovar Elisabethville]EBH8772590.1 transcriptional regulator [Salmonella enterica subsp. enterica serovar Lagos]EBV8483692.1 transcriptional regulator [Salmonella enterica subsp. enterica serovar Ago]EBW3367837.1 transcriptional regulator [Salmonella enterica s